MRIMGTMEGNGAGHKPKTLRGIDMSKATYSIISEETYDANHTGSKRYLTALGGCIDNGEDYGLGDWTYQVNVDVTNDAGENRSFTVAFQPEERTNGLQNYAGWEVAAAGRYGYDADESSELEEFCDYDDSIIRALEDRATAKAKAELEDLLEKLASGDIEPNQDA